MNNIEEYKKYLLFPTQENLGIFSSERFISETIKNPYGEVLVHHSDPAYLSGGKGLFERHNLPYPKGIVHVGMWKFEESDDYECLVGNKVIGIEANPDVYDSFSKPIGDIHDFQVYGFAAWDTDGDQLELHFDHSRMDCSTVFDNTKSNFHVVYTKRLDTFFNEYGVDLSEYNCLNVDAEGAELRILKGCGEDLNKFDYVMVETSFDDRFNSDSDLESIENYLSELGFEIKEIDSKFANYGWGDVFFVRKK